MEVQKHYKKCFCKKSGKKSKADFFPVLFYHVFGRFSVRGVQKHHFFKQSYPGPFWPLTHPPTTAVTGKKLPALE
jgi:hypothetical protein